LSFSSIYRVLREQGCQVAARTYRAWRNRRPAARTIGDAQVVNAIRDTASPVNPEGRRVLAAEGLYGRRKMTAYLRRTTMPAVSSGAVDRAMRILGLSGVRRDKGICNTTPAKDGKRAEDPLNRDFTADAPNQVWVTDFIYCRSWAGFCYVAFILDVFAQRIVAWHAATTKTTELVMTPLRMALWTRGREGHPTQPGRLIHHSDAGSQYTSIRFTEHLDLEGIRPSIGSVGYAFDNALMETIIGLFKAECIRTTVFRNGPNKTLAEVEYAHRWLGRLVQQPQAPRINRDGPTSRIRFMMPDKCCAEPGRGLNMERVGEVNRVAQTRWCRAP
jgi:putative transposase